VKRIFFALAMTVAFVCAAAALGRQPAHAQTGVTAEALGQANLRATPDVNSAQLGEIRAGTRYPVLARSQFYPWIVVADPASLQPLGWVFRDLVNIQGDLNGVPFSEAPVSTANSSLPSPSPPPAPTLTVPDSAALPTGTPAFATPAAPSSVIGVVNGEINVRYGPGVDFQRLGVANAGDRFAIVRWHTGLPWVEIAYPESPSGTGWVAVELLQVEGDLYSLPSTSQTQFALPSLTPTPSPLESPALPGLTPVPLSPAFQALGDQLWALMLGGGFDPATSRLGGLFLMNLQTGEYITVGSDIAFSGTSMSKIAILAAVYQQLNQPPNDEQAFNIAQTMICSENITTNRLLSALGGGNPYTGAEQVSAFLEQAGFTRTFIYTPYANDPFITPQAPRTRITDADQTAAQPDPFNQMTVGEMGALLNSVYQCGFSESGLLIDNFGEQFTPTECRQMLNVMSYNLIGSFIEVGTDETARVAHKHGWIEDTHGDAAVVFSAGGNYILVIALHNAGVLEFGQSAPVVEEGARLVYNYFNPTAPLGAVRDVTGSATCNLLGSPVIDELMALNFP
jgi:uncharacterized protein YraI